MQIIQALGALEVKTAALLVIALAIVAIVLISTGEQPNSIATPKTSS